MRKECEQHRTPARDNQYRATARYYVDSCPYCQIEQLQSQLHLLAKAVLEAHSADALTDLEGNGNWVPELIGCQCEACRVAREVLKCKPIQS